MGWDDPPRKRGQPPPAIRESIIAAAQHFKATKKRWPNFVRVSPEDALALGDRLNGLRIIGDPAVGKSYRLLIGYSDEVE